MNIEELTCQELVELVTAYFEGALADGELRLFEEHLEVCDGCRRYLAQMRTTIELTGRLAAESLEPEARDTLLAAFRTWSITQRG
jgi:anti-sigma factor RsiW